MRALLILLTLSLVACSPKIPDASQRISDAAKRAPYPQLEPLDALLARSEAGSDIVVQTEALSARVLRLKARAAALRGRSIVDGATRLRLQQAAARNAERQNG